MVDIESKASEYKRLAADWLEVAERISLHEDRALMLDMAHDGWNSRRKRKPSNRKVGLPLP